ncbi:hypothetical protein EK0264_13080 [Epidermidibacterium keratini]|uniref:Helicase XPB/Ssl2 N-terminal domain-containing protein n=1 Tax=Epidermidibacterium keratini TaxID=1891644 RepID=A0A7L4YQF7_9ACTN|nr:helicase-associated domain-containing protein [Epidermidibacterium keratini]QHC01134.1 hypothetical protein EK0264_13080 [Epidermidibacterium keratini]
MTPRPRTLAEWLRSRDDDWLRALISARPDVSFPPPSDFSTLAQRLGVRVSVTQACDDLDAWHTQVLEGLLLCPAPAHVDDVHAMLPDVDREAVSSAIDRLRSLALVWGEDDSLNVVGTVREVSNRFVAGLGRPAAELFIGYPNDDIRTVMRHLQLPYAAQPTATALVAEKLRTAQFVQEVLERAPQGSRDVLDRLSGQVPAGELSGADNLVEATDDSPPVRWLLSHGLLTYVGSNYVELPREVGLVLRGNRQLGPALIDPPAYDGKRLSQSDADGAGATHLQDAVRQLTDLIELIGQQRPRVLRTGGLGTREARKLAKSFGDDLSTTHLLLHIAQVAGLISASSQVDSTWLPTDKYDAWRDEPLESQWSALATAWLGMQAQPWLADPGVGETPHVLSAGTNRASAPTMRARILTAADALGPGAVATVPSVTAYAGWRWPRRMSHGAESLIEHTLREAEGLGITGRGALSSMGRALLHEPDRLAAIALAALPEPVEHVLLQADHTAIAPGRLSADLAHDMHLIADVESAGGATVFRISDASVRRGLDHGLSVGEIHAILRERSATPPPQSLSYLIDDVGRRHGALRIGGASAYLRCDDESQLDTLLSHASLAGLELRRIAPTVVVCTSAPEDLLVAVREAGFAPSFENSSGVIAIAPEDEPRARPKATQLARRSGLDDHDVTEIVHRLRTSDKARSSLTATGSIPGVSTASTLAVLNDAVAGHSQLSMDYIDENARMSTRLVVPSRLAGGYLYAYDQGSKSAQRFAVHRIMAVSLAYAADD